MPEKRASPRLNIGHVDPPVSASSGLTSNLDDARDLHVTVLDPGLGKNRYKKEN
jgi:hypothetical protein